MYQGAKAFGNVQGHHIRESQFHEALQKYSLLVCNAEFQLKRIGTTSFLTRLRELCPNAILLANIQSLFVPTFGENSEYWNGFRAWMDDDSYYSVIICGSLCFY